MHDTTPTDQERLDAWKARMLAKAPDPSHDPERLARLARLLGLGQDREA